MLLILAGISIIMLTGENGILKRAGESGTLDDISQTKELIKLELIEKTSENREYTNDDVIEAVKKITDKDVEKNAGTVLSKKGNEVDISDLWKKTGTVKFAFYLSSEIFESGYEPKLAKEVESGTSWAEALGDSFKNWEPFGNSMYTFFSKDGFLAYVDSFSSTTGTDLCYYICIESGERIDVNSPVKSGNYFIAVESNKFYMEW